jgi:hypothetical protein
MRARYGIFPVCHTVVHLFPGSSAVEHSTVKALYIFFTSKVYIFKMTREKRTYSDRKEYLKQAVIRRRKVLMQKAIEYKGSKCICCGYSKCSRALSFHHVNPSEKSFGISARGITRSWEKTRAELDKCVLVCANCHAEIHDNIRQLPRAI